MKQVLLMIFLILFLGGCASSGPAKPKLADIDWDNVETPEGEKLYCRKDYVTGTHIKTMTCLTQAEKDAARKNSGTFFTKLKGTPQNGPSGN